MALAGIRSGAVERLKRTLAIVIAAMGLVWVVATGVFLFFAADLVPIPWLLVAFGAMDGAFGLALALLITTNTRVAWQTDPYAQTTDDLLRTGVMIGDRPYGRRAHDDSAVVKRLIDKLEQTDAARPPPPDTPQWAADLVKQSEAAGLLIPDAREER